MNDLQAAVEDYDRAIQLNPADAAAYHNRGLARREQGDLPGAVEDYDRAIQLNPADAGAYTDKAITLRLLERYDEAAAVYRQAAAIKPDSLFAWAGLAALARRRGDSADLREAIEKAAPLLDEEKDLYNAACFYSIAGEVARALALLAKAIEERPSRVDWAKEDPDLAWIRDDPRFWEIVGDKREGKFDSS